MFSLFTGAVVGFVIISFFLSIFVDLGVMTSLTPRDPRWVGAWWLGFVIFGALCVFWSLWLLGFPREFPATKERREIEMKDMEEKVIEVQKFGGEAGLVVHW